MRCELRIYIHNALCINGIVNFGVANRTLAHGLNYGITIYGFYLQAALFLQAIGSVAKTVVLNPTVIAVFKTLTTLNNVTSIKRQSCETSRFVVEGKLHTLIANNCLVERESLHHFGRLSICLYNTQLATFYELILLKSYLMSSSSIVLCIAEHYMQGEQYLVTHFLSLCKVSLSQLQSKGCAIGRSHSRQFYRFSAYHIAILHHLVNKVHVLQVLESIRIAQSNLRCIFCLVNAIKCELHKLMCSFHLLKFSSFLTQAIYHTIAAEVALVRTWIVISRSKAIDALLHELWVVDRLIYPIPNATTDCCIRTFHHIPIFAQVTNGITHGVCIFTEEHGFVKVRCVLVHPVHARIHFRVEVRVTFATIRQANTSTFVVYRT